MNDRTWGLVNVIGLIRPALWTTVLGLLLLAYGCASDSHEMDRAANYPSGISEDIEQQLKYDARVDSFDTGSDDLIAPYLLRDQVVAPGAARNSVTLDAGRSATANDSSVAMLSGQPT